MGHPEGHPFCGLRGCGRCSGGWVPGRGGTCWGDVGGEGASGSLDVPTGDGEDEDPSGARQLGGQARGREEGTA